MHFRDIPQFTQEGDWECNYPIDRFIITIDSWVSGEDTEAPLELNPDFQRGHVWNEQQQIDYVEFILKGGKTGRVIYLNNPIWGNYDNNDYNDFVCVDGLQRITAIRRFVNNEIKALGYYFREFKGNTRMIKDMKININSLQTRKEVLQWYIEMNSGGTVHTEEEINRVKELLKNE